MVVSNVINRPPSATAKFNTIVKIYKYKGLHERHHFILMAMEVHGIPQHDMDRFIRECAHLFHVVIYPCLFTFNFSGNMLVLLFNVL
jgi:hypothetical protein